MADATGPISSRGLIPLPREVIRAHAKPDGEDPEDRDSHEFQEELEEQKTLHPLKSKRNLFPGHVDGRESRWVRVRPDRREEGLGSDLDLLG